jgi:hypothetical protein
MLDRKTNHNHFSALLKHLRQTQNDAADLVEILVSRHRSPDFEAISCFETAEPHDFKALSKILTSPVQKAESLAWPLVDSHLNAPSYLPIRAFRGEPSRLWVAVDKLRIFLSSGTNSGPEGRSRSAFTPEGLRFYKAASIAGFLGVLETLVLPFSDDFLNISILSLLPDLEKWPDSSLAQMISWFGEVWPLTYADHLNLNDVLTRIEDTSKTKQPICILGTAFHYVHFLDAWERAGKPKLSLPKGSILIETGGTKGKSRDITRGELYKLMSDAFAVETSSIVSEYGMCELASQAWDFVVKQSDSDLARRHFKFPWWVTLAVMTHPSRAEQTGTGTLVVHDQARIDLLSRRGIIPIQTEDLVNLEQGGLFTLQGRVPNAPLKGCSMLAEPLVSSAANLEHAENAQTKSAKLGPYLRLNSEVISQKAQSVRKWFLDLCTDLDAQKRLSNELQSTHLAKEALSDLLSGMPNDDDELVASLLRSEDTLTTPQRWLLIAPSSHSLALIHPVMAGLLLGLDMRVRAPTIAGLKGKDTFLFRATQLAAERGFQINTLSSEWRLGPSDLLAGEHVLIFGDDDTCGQFKKFAPGRVNAFGHITSLTVVNGREFMNPVTCRKILHDQLALRQRGCLSSRAIIAIGGRPDEISERLYSALPEVLLDDVETPGETAARSMEFVRLMQNGFHVKAWKSSIPCGKPQVLIGVTESSLENLGSRLFAGLSRLEMVIPVVILPETTLENELIGKLPKSMAVKALSISENVMKQFEECQKSKKSVDKMRLARHGSLDSPAFDGTHLGRPFFATGD